MLCPPSIIIISLLSLLTPTRSYICTSPHGILPMPKDCHELIDAIEVLSHIHPFDTPKLWSRHVEDSVSAQKLPKDYWLQGRGPSTCAIHVDVIPFGDLNAQDTFPFQSLATVGEIVVEQCLIRRRELGLAYPGARENIQAKIIRTDAPWRKSKVSMVRNLGRLGNGTSLFEATAKVKKHHLIRPGGNVSEER